MTPRAKEFSIKAELFKGLHYLFMENSRAETPDCRIQSKPRLPGPNLLRVVDLTSERPRQNLPTKSPDPCQLLPAGSQGGSPRGFTLGAASHLPRFLFLVV